MSILPEDSEKDAALRTWVEALAGARIADVQRIGGGAFRTSCRVRLTHEDGSPADLFLKIDRGSAPKTPFDLRREHDLLVHLDGRGRAPRVLGFHDGACAMAMECLPGDARFDAIEDGAQRTRIEASFAEALAEIHRIDIASLGLAHLPAGLAIDEAIAADLDLWQALLAGGVRAPDPIALFALAWCRVRRPADNRPATLVQGDAGPGNFLFDTQRVTGVVDWEMTHLGHPLEDLGCVMARSLAQPMAPARRLLDLYRAASGQSWRDEELRYATILVMARFSVPISLALESRNTGLDYGLTNGYFRLSLISLLLLIADAEGLTLDETVPTEGRRPAIDFEFDYLRAVLGDIVSPVITDPYVRYRLDGAVGLIGYLDAALADHATTDPIDVDAAITDAAGLITAGGPMLGQAMQAMLAEALHREALMRPMLGPLHGRRVHM